MRLEGRVEQALDIRRQRAVGFKKYIWRSQDDARVRLSHAMNDDRVFEYDKSPAVTGHPGDDFGCRCRAEILAEGRGEARTTVPDQTEVAGIGIVIKEIMRRVATRSNKIRKTLPRRLPKPKDILSPNGKHIGRKGKHSKVREVEGGEKAAKELFEKLSKGGKPETPPGYKGEGIRLPNGDWLGYRPTSKSGPPTIDLDVVGISFRKIHFP